MRRLHAAAAALRGVFETAQKQQREQRGQRHHGGEVPLRRRCQPSGRRAEQPGTEEAKAPERVRTIHDASPAQVFDTVGLEVDDELDGADAQPGRQQAQEQRERSAGVRGKRVERRQHRYQHEQRAPVPDAFDRSPGEAQRDKCSAGGADEAEAELALGDAHRALQLRQTRKEAAEGEGVQEERCEDLTVRGQAQADAAGIDRAHGFVGKLRRWRELPPPQYNAPP